jgi:hypothetical protein
VLQLTEEQEEEDKNKKTSLKHNEYGIMINER